jgi:hypothetical protein
MNKDWKNIPRPDSHVVPPKEPTSPWIIWGVIIGLVLLCGLGFVFRQKLGLTSSGQPAPTQQLK